jgi:hypothetical protein
MGFVHSVFISLTNLFMDGKDKARYQANIDKTSKLYKQDSKHHNILLCQPGGVKTLSWEIEPPHPLSLG